MIEKALTLSCVVAGTLLTYMAGRDIYWDSGAVTLVAYTIGVLALGAGIRSIVKE